MTDQALLEKLAAEADRRAAAIIEGAEALAAAGSADPDRVRALAAEAHALKGAAAVVGQERLAALAAGMERALEAPAREGRMDVSLAGTLVAAASALREGASAAAEGVAEPVSVADSLAKLSG